ncbi:MAG TPA: holo-ACP synthase [Candidatus Halomonas stercoripullorum]|uniref:Holo-[acyl-carrier-protein] synthase n=1 Tax=Candidatus Halomonas stercoripullorum TaxID=2838617 RepID=A0A9D1WQ56_9GAMM|nr:holo-ACP synthase [Candidatus Halomonas stercoripullorum]
MILGVGTDLAKIARFEAALARHGARFPARILGELEHAQWHQRNDKAAFLAKRFAAKEAFVKALGVGLRHGMRWGEIQVINDALGRPLLQLSGRAGELAEAAGVRTPHLSLSDEAGLALAMVVLEGAG